MKEKLENLVKRLRVLARGIARGNCDPDDLVHGFVEYYLINEEKLMDHPNLIAFAVWKMKNLYIDELRKSKNLTSLTDQEGKDMEIVDDKQPDKDGHNERAFVAEEIGSGNDALANQYAEQDRRAARARYGER